MPYIFGYGSLVEPNEIRQYLTEKTDIYYVRAEGFQRVFNVSVNNMQQLEGYKYYLDKNGLRPDIYVTFLNIVRNSNAEILGSVFYINDDKFDVVDKRERNYDRIEINQFLDRKFNDIVWAYVGKEKAVRLYEEGKCCNKSVISKKYYDLVFNAFNAIGKKQHFLDSTKPIEVDIMELTRVNTR